MTRNELAWEIRRKIASRAGKKANKVSWKYCYGVAGKRIVEINHGNGNTIKHMQKMQIPT